MRNWRLRRSAPFGGFFGDISVTETGLAASLGIVEALFRQNLPLAKARNYASGL